MPEEGHLRRTLPIVRGLRMRGYRVHVLTDNRFHAQVVSAGGEFIDLFARWPLAGADASSRPIPCRYVSFAGHYGSEIVEAAGALAPRLVIYDTFAVIGPVVAKALGVPGINICAGHNVAPAPFLEMLASDPRVDLSPTCHAAVERLRTVHGMVEASPFSYVNGLSESLNIYCEPPEFLSVAERSAFEPVAFFGSLPSVEHIDAPRRRPVPSYFGRGTEGRRVYISFGTVVWRYFATEALAAMATLADVIAADKSLDAVISFAGNDAADVRGANLSRHNVRVEKRVNQWSALNESDVFVTHHGLNSTHEAIFNRVGMVSYPFFWDQPGLAAKCREFGIAVPLCGGVRTPVSRATAARALHAAFAGRDILASSLEAARARELAVMATRPAVLDRLAAL